MSFWYFMQSIQRNKAQQIMGQVISTGRVVKGIYAWTVAYIAGITFTIE